MKARNNVGNLFILFLSEYRSFLIETSTSATSYLTVSGSHKRSNVSSSSQFPATLTRAQQNRGSTQSFFILFVKQKKTEIRFSCRAWRGFRGCSLVQVERWVIPHRILPPSIPPSRSTSPPSPFSKCSNTVCY